VDSARGERKKGFSQLGFGNGRKILPRKKQNEGERPKKGGRGQLFVGGKNATEEGRSFTLDHLCEKKEKEKKKEASEPDKGKKVNEKMTRLRGSRPKSRIKRENHNQR